MAVDLPVEAGVRRPGEPGIVLMIAPTQDLSMDKRIVQTCNSLARAGKRLRVIIPHQAKQKNPLGDLLDPSVRVFEIPFNHWLMIRRWDTTDLFPRPLKRPFYQAITRFLQRNYYPRDLIPWRERLWKFWPKYYSYRFLWHLIFPLLGEKAPTFLLLCQVGQVRFQQYRSLLKIDCYNHAYFLKALEIAGRERVEAIYCHDLWALPAATLTKSVIDAPLIYDTHEIGTTVFEDPESRKVAERLEGWLYGQVDRMLTVNESVSDYYHAKFPQVKPLVITNAPPFWDGRRPTDRKELRERRGFAPDSVIGVIVGIVNKVSVLEMPLRALALADAKLCLLIVGDGAALEEARGLAGQLGLLGGEGRPPRVVFTGSVPFTRVSSTISGADFGIVPNIQKYTNLGMNSSSKLYDYMQAEMPTISDHGVEIDKVFARFGNGKTIDFFMPPEKLAAELTDFAQDLARYSQNLVAAKRHYIWPLDFAEIVFGNLSKEASTQGA